MEPPVFYLYAKASGLVEEKLLDEILLEFQSDRAPGSGIPFQGRARGGEPCDLRHLQKTAKLRNGRRRFGIDTVVDEENSNDDTSASLDGETGPVDRTGLTDLDRRFAYELVRLGILNRWQSHQLLEGRTKFTLGDFSVLDAIGKGGYGHVFLGREKKEGENKPPSDGFGKNFVALKVLPLSKTTPELTHRFQHEIDLQRPLAHPNLVRFYTSGRDGSVHYMVHEFIDGGDLRMLCQREETLPIDVAAAIVSQIARAVQYLHEQGIVHRDIKPGNVLLSSDGTAKLVDLGLAVSMRSEAEPGAEKRSGKTDKATGKVAGTVDYIAPDQIRNPAAPTPAWDVYSLGCTLYHLLTGTVPFPQGNRKQKFQAHLTMKPVDPRIFNQAIPFDIVDLLRAMLTKSRRERVATAAEVADRLDPWTTPKRLREQLVFGERETVDSLPSYVPLRYRKRPVVAIPAVPEKKQP